MLQISSLDLEYSWNQHHRQIFNQLTLTVDQGAFVSVTGSNGSGKTSLLKLILGLLIPDSGSIAVQGKPVVAGKPWGVSQGQIAYLAQHIEDLFFAERVRDELTVSTGGEQSRKSWLKQLGIPALLDRKIDSLSGGERQSLALAQFMSSSAPLLLLDEPTSYLDAERTRILADFLKTARADGRTILHATQFSGEVSWGTHLLDLDVPNPQVQPC